MKLPAESEIVVLGAARNVERTLERQTLVFERAFASFRKASLLIVESDSSDRTLDVLSRLKDCRQNFHFVSLGKLEREFPLRTQRIARARNAGVEICQNRQELSGADYFAVADWDGVNLQLTTNAVNSCWDCGAWDVVTASQPEGYYDVWALRHPVWCPGDCWEEYRKLEPEFGSEIAHEIAVSSKRVRIPQKRGAIDVDSAFGGLAIYKRDIFFKAKYIGESKNKEQVCEHVPFHATLKSYGARIIINPALVNTYSHQNSLPFFSAERLKYSMRRLIGLGCGPK